MIDQENTAKSKDKVYFIDISSVIILKEKYKFLAKELHPDTISDTLTKDSFVDMKAEYDNILSKLAGIPADQQDQLVIKLTKTPITFNERATKVFSGAAGDFMSELEKEANTIDLNNIEKLDWKASLKKIFKNTVNKTIDRELS